MREIDAGDRIRRNIQVADTPVAASTSPSVLVLCRLILRRCDVRRDAVDQARAISAVVAHPVDIIA
jgi:hypothetical protein